MPRQAKYRTVYDPDEVVTIHQIVTLLIDDLDEISAPDFQKLLVEMLEQAHLRRVFHVVERFVSHDDGYEIY